MPPLRLPLGYEYVTPFVSIFGTRLSANPRERWHQMDARFFGAEAHCLTRPRPASRSARVRVAVRRRGARRSARTAASWRSSQASLNTPTAAAALVRKVAGGCSDRPRLKKRECPMRSWSRTTPGTNVAEARSTSSRSRRAMTMCSRKLDRAWSSRRRGRSPGRACPGTHPSKRTRLPDGLNDRGSQRTGT